MLQGRPARVLSCCWPRCASRLHKRQQPQYAGCTSCNLMSAVGCLIKGLDSKGRAAGEAGPSPLVLLATLRFAPAQTPAAPVRRLNYLQPPAATGAEPCLLALGGQPADQPDELVAFTSLQASTPAYHTCLLQGCPCSAL